MFVRLFSPPPLRGWGRELSVQGELSFSASLPEERSAAAAAFFPSLLSPLFMCGGADNSFPTRWPLSALPVALPGEEPRGDLRDGAGGSGAASPGWAGGFGSTGGGLPLPSLKKKNIIIC